MEPKQALAHISEDGQRTQTVAAHLDGTARRSASFAAAFGAEQDGYYTGTLHDIGKYSAAFQRRLHGGERVDHSTAGAQMAFRQKQFPAAFAVAGHHGGLPDGGSQADTGQDSTLMGRIKRNNLPPYDAWKEEICPPPTPPLPPAKTGYEMAFYTRMLFSCLVDADYLDTEQFMDGAAPPRGGHATISALLKLLNEHIAPWWQPKTELNARRCEILRACLDTGAQGSRGLYTLTVPTGGGKTIASLAFALTLAAAQGMDRVIYVIPYTSIIDQTAAVFAEILGEENVLAHHSGAAWSADENSTPASYRKALAAENWDVPIVVTTSVQFFESLYGNRPSQCRKLHNIANSVIIFDEAQNLPVPYLRPCVAAIAELVRHFRAAAVLCTATQPALGPLFAEFAPELPLREICPEPTRLYEQLRRVTLKNAGSLTQQELGEQLAALPQVLCVVNRRKTAQELFAALPQEGSFCLTTLLYPAHRKAALQEIRRRLDVGLPCRVVSTSLIEAGVDVDFPAVYREMAGLDAILQAAGRCNREGKNAAETSLVTVFTLDGQSVPKMIQLNVQTTERVLQHYDDPTNLAAIEEYFTFYRSLKGDIQLDAKNILSDFQNKLMPFATVADKFRIIEESTVTVYIPQGEGKELTDQLRTGWRSRSLFRKLGQYGVPVYPDHLHRLEQAGAVQQLDTDLWVLEDLHCYHDKTGLALDVETGQAWFV